MEIQSRTKFCHFTSLDNARNILASESFFLSKYSKMNDLAEKKIHEIHNDRVFVLCFSNSEALNIPAFYLYGGIDGKGCRIQFTDTKMREIINHSSIFYVNKNYKILKKPIPPSEYTIYFDWIYYISKNGFCEHKNDKSNDYSSIDEALVDLEKENKHFFVKNPIWKYENEFRVVVVFKNAISYDSVALKFEIKDNDKGISVVFGPETEQKEYLELSKEFRDYGISKFKSSTSYAISMNLVQRNRRLLK